MLGAFGGAFFSTHKKNYDLLTNEEAYLKAKPFLTLRKELGFYGTVVTQQLERREQQREQREEERSDGLRRRQHSASTATS